MKLKRYIIAAIILIMLLTAAVYIYIGTAHRSYSGTLVFEDKNDEYIC